MHKIVISALAVFKTKWRGLNKVLKRRNAKEPTKALIYEQTRLKGKGSLPKCEPSHVTLPFNKVSIIVPAIKIKRMGISLLLLVFFRRKPFM